MALPARNTWNNQRAVDGTRSGASILSTVQAAYIIFPFVCTPVEDGSRRVCFRVSRLLRLQRYYDVPLECSEKNFAGSGDAVGQSVFLVVLGTVPVMTAGNQ